MKQSISIVFALVLLINLPGCSGDDAAQDEAATINDVPETTEDIALSPEETLARLIELAQAGDWETYVDDFYGESDKFEGKAERRDAVVARFRDKWGATVVAAFEALDKGTAKISDDGKKAVFFTDGEPGFNLFLSDDGRWTFHL